MVFDYDNARSIADTTISKYGGAVQLVTKGSTSGFDSNGDATPDTPDTFIDGISTPFVKFLLKEIDGESIQDGDSWVYFQSDDEPLINMQLTINSKTLRVIAVEVIGSTEGVNIYFKLQLRK
jgi:hypothetical protein